MKEILVDLEKCLACKTCEITCAVEHSQSKNLFSAIFEKPLPKQRVFVEYAEGYELGTSFPIQCRHCEDAPCVGACISGAMTKDEKTGIVSVDEDRCIGCSMCVMVCPFGVIVPAEETRISLKCDQCKHREIPACVESCPLEALQYLDPGEVTEEKRKKIVRIVAGTKPRVEKGILTGLTLK